MCHFFFIMVLSDPALENSQKISYQVPNYLIFYVFCFFLYILQFYTHILELF